MNRPLVPSLCLSFLAGLTIACAPPAHDAPGAQVDANSKVESAPPSNGAAIEILDLPVETGGYRLAETKRYSVQVFAPDAVIERHIVRVGPKSTPLMTIVVRDGEHTLTFGWDSTAQTFSLDGAARALGTYTWRDGELGFVAARDGVGPAGIETPFGPSLPNPEGAGVDPHSGHNHDD